MEEIHYTLEVKTCFGKSYISVYPKNKDGIDNLKHLLEENNELVRNVTDSMSESKAHPGAFLNVRPTDYTTIEELEVDIKTRLDSFFSGVVYKKEDINSEAKFVGIEEKIITELDKAMATIHVCVAWFTNERLKDKLLEKYEKGIDVKVIIFDDGINKKNAVNLGGIPNIKIRAERKGIMHKKFCVIDNNTVITGSYNWTNNAEHRNDENIAVISKDLKLASQHTYDFNRMWCERNV